MLMKIIEAHRREDVTECDNEKRWQGERERERERETRGAAGINRRSAGIERESAHTEYVRLYSGVML